MNVFAELIEMYNEPVIIGQTRSDIRSIVAEAAADKERKKMIRRRKPRRNQFAELLDLFTTQVPTRREEETEKGKEENQMTLKCALCGKVLGYYEHPECGRPLVDGVVCKECKVKCRNYEDSVKASYPDSIRYYPYPSDVEDE